MEVTPACRPHHSSVWLIAVLLAADGCPALERATLSERHRGYVAFETFTPVLQISGLPMPTGEDPQSRMLAAACSPYHCIAHYEQSGYRRRFHVVLYGLFDQRAIVEWSGSTTRRTVDVAELKSLVVDAAGDGWRWGW